MCLSLGLTLLKFKSISLYIYFISTLSNHTHTHTRTIPFADDMFKNEMLQRNYHIFLFLVVNTYFEHILGYTFNRY